MLDHLGFEDPEAGVGISFLCEDGFTGLIYLYTGYFESKLKVVVI